MSISVQCLAAGTLPLKSTLGPNASDSSPSKCEVGREAQSLAGLESLGMRSDSRKKRWGYRPQARPLHLWLPLSVLSLTEAMGHSMLNTQTDYLGESAKMGSARRTEVLYQELIARRNMNLAKQIPAPKS